MNTIVTLCPACAKTYEEAYSVKKLSYKTTTSKKPTCEACHKRLSLSILELYLISNKGKGR